MVKLSLLPRDGSLEALSTQETVGFLQYLNTVSAPIRSKFVRRGGEIVFNTDRNAPRTDHRTLLRMQFGIDFPISISLWEVEDYRTIVSQNGIDMGEIEIDPYLHEVIVDGTSGNYRFLQTEMLRDETGSLISDACAGSNWTLTTSFD